MRLSFEFFPPKTAVGLDNLLEAQRVLSAFRPLFFSVTYGAGGSTRDGTLNAVTALRRAGADVAPHLSFGHGEEAETAALLDTYFETGARRVVALRGDAPSGSGFSRPRYAVELVRFIRQHSGARFRLEVAAYPETHPEASDPLADIGHLKAKLDAGADSAITQYFFSAPAYFRFVDDCRRAGIDQPIYPGVMPIGDVDGLLRFSDKCGAEVPRWLRLRLLAARDDPASLEPLAHDVVASLCAELLEGGAPGLHFYTLNRASLCARLCEALSLQGDTDSG